MQPHAATCTWYTCDMELASQQVCPSWACCNHFLSMLMLRCRYKGRPHWGKNYDRTFTHPDCPLRGRFPNFDRQLELQARYDPNKVFEPVLMQQIITGTPNVYSPQCDVKRQCFCTDDSHCATGHTCVQALAFPEYKVCKPVFLKNMLG